MTVFARYKETFGLTGRQAESALCDCGVTLNRNSLPGDPNGAWYTSGLRVGTPATTTLGMGKAEMVEIAKLLKYVLENVQPTKTKSGKQSKAKYVVDTAVITAARQRVQALLDKHPLYPELDMEILSQL